MKPLPIFGSVLAISLAIASPGALAHVGHGDEFQATGGISRVEVKPETDALLGIQASPIEVESEGGVLIPVTALVDDEGRQLVFVLYENFYEPVEVSTGETQGELIEVTQGLSIGEQLVTQGGLSLYAESRKTQTAEASTGDSETSSAATSNTPSAIGLSEADHAEADAKGIPHSHDDESHNHAEEGGGISKKLLAAMGGGVGLLVGAVVLLKGRQAG